MNMFQLNNLLLSGIKFYKIIISPFLIPCCRFHPTCSEFARQLLENNNSYAAFFLIIKRLLKCQPFCLGGFDPVQKIKNINKH